MFQGEAKKRKTASGQFLGREKKEEGEIILPKQLKPP